jgi:lipoate-protein ligase A
MSCCLWTIRLAETTAGEDGLLRQQAIAEELTDAGAIPKLLIWRCRRTLFVSRSETRLPRFDRAVAQMQAGGWHVVTRKSGGAACPAGPGTIQLSLIETASPMADMNAKYAAMASYMQRTLSRWLNIDVQIAAVADAYCPGRYDLAVQEKKIAGLSQYWFRNESGIRCVVTAASVNLEEPPDQLARAVNQFYAHADSPLRCHPAALTNIRLCAAMSKLPESDLPAIAMEQFTASTHLLERAIAHGTADSTVTET